LLHVLEHPNRERLIEQALKKVERWERRGRLDSDLAEELTERLEELLDEAQDDRPGRRGHHNAVDRFFSQIGNGRPRLMGRFRW
jgi:hypothetical protein